MCFFAILALCSKRTKFAFFSFFIKGESFSFCENKKKKSWKTHFFQHAGERESTDIFCFCCSLAFCSKQTKYAFFSFFINRESLSFPQRSKSRKIEKKNFTICWKSYGYSHFVHKIALENACLLNDNFATKKCHKVTCFFPFLCMKCKFSLFFMKQNVKIEKIRSIWYLLCN